MRRSFARLAILPLAFAFLAPVFSFPLTAAPLVVEEKGPFVSMGFEQALEKAQKEKKLVFVDFFTTWCGPCKMLDKTTWQDPKVIKWLTENTIPLKIDAEKEVALAKRYGVRAYPTMAFIKPDGKLLDTIIGYHPPEKFLPKAVAYLSGKTSIDMAREEMKGHEKDPSYRLRYAGALMDRGEKDAALKELIWCLDKGPQYDPEFRTFGLLRVAMYLSSLAKQSEPAKKALLIRRDQIEKEFVSTPNNTILVNVLSVMNRGLDQPGRMLAFYDELKAKGDSAKTARGMVGRFVIRPLIEAKRYQDVLDDAGDVQRMFTTSENIYQKQSVELAVQLSRQESVKRLDDFRRSMVRDYGLFYEALVGTGRIEEAEILARNLAKFDNRPETLTLLMNHAIRAGSRKSALAGAELRQNLAKPEERAIVEAAAAKIPNEK